MKIVLISDTHLPRFRARLPAALRHVASERPDVILHCGDLTSMEGTEAFETIAPVEAIAGNNDGPEIVRRYGRQKIACVGDVRIGMIHGDGLRGTTLGRALAAFASERVHAIVFGHSHTPYVANHDGIWVANPGSITDKRREARFSYCTMETDGSSLAEPRLHYFDADVIEHPLTR